MRSYLHINILNRGRGHRAGNPYDLRIGDEGNDKKNKKKNKNE